MAGGDPDDWVVKWTARAASCRVCRWALRILTLGLMVKAVAALLGYPMEWLAAFAGAALGVALAPILWAVMLIAWGTFSKHKR